MVVTPHKINGRFYGAFYQLKSGESIYLAHRKKREIYRMKNAWCLDTRTLEECIRRGIKYAGVVIRSEGVTQYYVTPIKDFFDSPHSFPHFGDTRQRGLPLNCFLINPMKTTRHITKAMKIR